MFVSPPLPETDADVGETVPGVGAGEEAAQLSVAGGGVPSKQAAGLGQHSRKVSEGLVPIKNDLNKGVVWFDQFWTVPDPSLSSDASTEKTKQAS